MLCRAGRAVQLTRDHKPGIPSEYARIVVSLRSWASVVASYPCCISSIHAYVRGPKQRYRYRYRQRQSPHPRVRGSSKRGDHGHGKSGARLGLEC